MAETFGTKPENNYLNTRHSHSVFFKQKKLKLCSTVILTYLKDYLPFSDQKTGYKLQQEIFQVGLFAHLHSLPMKWHVNRHIGTVLKVANRGSRSVNDVLKSVFYSYFICSSHVFFNVLSTIVDFIVAVTVFTTALNIYFGLLVMITMIAHIGRIPSQFKNYRIF